MTSGTIIWKVTRLERIEHIYVLLQTHVSHCPQLTELRPLSQGAPSGFQPCSQFLGVVLARQITHVKNLVFDGN